MPMIEMLYLIGAVAAFTAFGVTLAICRAVSKDLPK
jgi:hypothetical protein